METIKLNVKKLISTGFFSVFFSNVFCKVMTFIGGMIIVRILSKNDYGSYTYVINCYGILCLINDLGCNSAANQFCSEYFSDKTRFNGFFTYGYKMGMLFSAITSLLILLAPIYYPFRDPNSARLAQLLFLVPFISTTNAFLLTNLRVRLENNKFAKINIFNSIIHYLIILPLSYYWGIKGAVISNYFINFAVLVYSLIVSYKYLDFDWKSSVLLKDEKKSFLKLSVGSQTNNAIEQALVLMDIFLIGIIIGDNVVISSYKVATTIPSALAFVPSSIMVYVVPYFARNNKNTQWVKTNFAKLIVGSFALNLFIALVSIALGPWMVPLVFGKQYSDAVLCFSILMIGYFFNATFRVTSANIIYTMRKVKVNIYITIISGILNCIMDVLLILNYGSLGAAIATASVQVINAFISFAYMLFYLRRSSKNV